MKNSIAWKTFFGIVTMAAAHAALGNPQALAGCNPAEVEGSSAHPPSRSRALVPISAPNSRLEWDAGSLVT